MSRRFKLSNNYFDDNIKIFNKCSITLQKGLTVLVGCNGAGKTTMLRQISSSLRTKDIPYLFHSNLIYGEKEFRNNVGFYGDFQKLATSMMSSEGENIALIMSVVAGKMGRLVSAHPDAKEYWFLFDAIDSGLSIDNIIDIKENLISFVISENKNADVYFIVSANSYEFARNENCFDVINGRYLTFGDYEEYREFVLSTKQQKDLRYN